MQERADFAENAREDPIMRMLMWAALLVTLPYGGAGAQPVSADIAAAVASPMRPAADVARDVLRHPAALLGFSGIVPGEKVADLMPGGGYFTRLFSVLVGQAGHVYAIVPEELTQVSPKALAAARAVAAEPAMLNVSVLVEPTARIAAPEKLDVVWTSDNYHDVYGFLGADRALAMDRAIFAALKPGGHFIVIDHVAAAGTSATAPGTLHRIDPSTVRAQVEAAGFVFDAECKVLRNAQDDHVLKVFDPAIRGHTDQFGYSFRKPGPSTP
jgi:predicted methyltransferase